jgi:CRP-like cAMP-binding protein
LGADQDIVREGDCPVECCLVLEGMVFRYLMLDDGRRQIMGFYIPGDIPDLQSLHIKIMDHSVGTLVPTTVALIPHQSLNNLNARYPRIANALWRDTIVDAAMFRLWMVGLGRKSAHERIAHLFCELLMRFKTVGIAKDALTCEFPMTQTELGDALGLSTVQVNRVVQDLRADGLVILRGSSLHINDWNACSNAPSSTRPTSTWRARRQQNDLCGAIIGSKSHIPNRTAVRVAAGRRRSGTEMVPSSLSTLSACRSYRL